MIGVKACILKPRTFVLWTPHQEHTESAIRKDHLAPCRFKCWTNLYSSDISQPLAQLQRRYNVEIPRVSRHVGRLKWDFRTDSLLLWNLADPQASLSTSHRSGTNFRNLTTQHANLSTIPSKCSLLSLSTYQQFWTRLWNPLKQHANLTTTPQSQWLHNAFSAPHYLPSPTMRRLPDLTLTWFVNLLLWNLADPQASLSSSHRSGTNFRNLTTQHMNLSTIPKCFFLFQRLPNAISAPPVHWLTSYNLDATRTTTRRCRAPTIFDDLRDQFLPWMNLISST